MIYVELLLNCSHIEIVSKRVCALAAMPECCVSEHAARLIERIAHDAMIIELKRAALSEQNHGPAFSGLSTRFSFASNMGPSGLP